MLVSNERLQRDDWIRAAWAALVAGGVDGVRVEALARQLGVSKGSFYWHFKDRAELLEEVLRYWERSTPQIIAEADAGATAPERLARLVTTVTSVSDPLAHLALHAWASRDPAVAARVAVVERRRIAYITALLRAGGLPLAAARWRAELAYLSYLGWLDRASRDPALRNRPLPHADELVRLLLTPIDH